MITDPFKPGLLSRLPKNPEKVAIVCASRIGDFLCATPAFRALKMTVPAAKYTLIGLPFIREMAERNPHLDGFEAFPGFPGIAEQFFDAREALLFFQKMQQQRFDFAVQMHGSGVYSNTFTLMLGARSTAGFIREGDVPGRLNAAMHWPVSLHAARRALALATFLGAHERGRGLEFPVSAGDIEVADSLLHGCNTPLIGIHTGSRDSSKIWPEERFAAAGASLRRILKGTVVILGGPEENLAGQRIARVIGKSSRNLSGRVSICEMGALISRLSVLITNDSGPAHIAYALAVPSVTLFGKTEPAEWGPPERDCHRAVRAVDRKMSSIPVEDVVRAAVGVTRLA